MAKDAGTDAIPAHLKDKINPVKNRILFLSPSVVAGEEKEATKNDFESLTNANIGVGGFGKVYKVKHKVSKNIYAIKVINKGKILENDLTEQMKLEVRIMYKLDHPNIIKLYNHFEDDESFYLILEYAPKGQLFGKLKMLGRLDERHAAQYIREIVSAVEYLHSLKPAIIHRDIKPENILLDANEAAKLCDFGWSNFFNSDRKRLTYCGTPEYLAPEMIKQAGHDEALDLWNVGVLMFELLTGRPPFEGTTQKELFENIVRVKINYPKDFSKLAKDVIQRLLKSNPAERIKIAELLEHPWFKSNPPLRAIAPKKAPEEEKTGDMKYEAVSKKSIVNSGKENSKLKQEVSKQAPEIATTAGILNKGLEELSKELQTTTKEHNELKIAHQLMLKELEAVKRENDDIKAHITTAGKGYVPPNAGDARKLTEEMQRLKTLVKNRDELLTELDQHKALLSEHATKLQLQKNELEIEQNARTVAMAKATDWQEKYESLEKKYESQRQTLEELKRQKKFKETELESKIEVMQMKLVSKSEDKSADNSEAMADVIKMVLDEIKDKLKTQVKDKKDDEGLRKELTAIHAKLTELKTKHETEMYDVQTQYDQKIAALKNEHKAAIEACLKQEATKAEKSQHQLQEVKKAAEAHEKETATATGQETLIAQLKRTIEDMKLETALRLKEEASLHGKLKKSTERINDLEYAVAELKDKLFQRTIPAGAPAKKDPAAKPKRK
jgi:serine/threonine protein kinase